LMSVATNPGPRQETQPQFRVGHAAKVPVEDTRQRSAYSRRPPRPDHSVTAQVEHPIFASVVDELSRMVVALRAI